MAAVIENAGGIYLMVDMVVDMVVDIVVDMVWHLMMVSDS